MTPQQVRLVQTSWLAVEAMGPPAAALFYQRLFSLDASLRPLFRGDIDAQGHKLMAMLGSAVPALDRLDEIVPSLQALGRRHAGYGVLDRDYDTVGAALLWTLEQGLGGAFTREVREAWTGAYRALASTMQQVTRSEGAAPPLGRDRR